MCVKGINWQWLPSPLRLSSVLGCCVRLMLLGADPLLEGWWGGAGEAHATTARFPVLLTSGVSFVRFTSVAQNSGPFGGVVSGLRLSEGVGGGRLQPPVLLAWVSRLHSSCGSESGWAGGGRVLPPILLAWVCGFCVRFQRTEPSPPTMRQIAQGPGCGLNCGLCSGIHSAPRFLVTSHGGLITS